MKRIEIKSVVFQCQQHSSSFFFASSIGQFCLLCHTWFVTFQHYILVTYQLSVFVHLERLNFIIHIKAEGSLFSIHKYSKVPNNSAARLIIFEIFSYQHGLFWTYTLIKIQIIFLPTRLLSTILYFILSNFNAFDQFFH